jgi:hypothetical protein
MGLDATTKDCTALVDSEIAEMADLSAAHGSRFDIGYLSKQREEWVLVTQVHEGEKLRGYGFGSLERIGGTPCVLLGLLLTCRGAKADSVLKSVLSEQYRRALLAFPDEDVLVGARLQGHAAYSVFNGLVDVVPRPSYKATGEERAWGRRLAKRFGHEAGYDDHEFVALGDGDVVGIIDFESPKAAKQFGESHASLFEKVNPDRSDVLIAFGWVLAEDLAASRVPK